MGTCCSNTTGPDGKLSGKCQGEAIFCKECVTSIYRNSERRQRAAPPLPEERLPRLYVLRVFFYLYQNGERREEQRKVWAYAASDAVFQMKTEMERHGGRFYITYVGPDNPHCCCLNECRCGIDAPAAGPEKAQ